MMMEATISFLDPTLINQIAAGEVVERPSSIVKELCENAMDAKATCIEIHLEQGGLEAICVTDDGFGMSRQDAPLALQRYATSKLRSVSQLDQLTTWGFRGEALAAICSVSKCTLSTRRAKDRIGTKIEVRDGHTQQIASCGMVPGTSLLVENLFEHVPARKKFLRSSGTEASFVLDIVTRMAVVAPHISWRLTHGKRTLLHLPNTMTTSQERFAAIWRRQITSHYDCTLKDQQEEIEVYAQFVTGRTRHLERTKLWLFVNGRIIKDYTLARFIFALLDQANLPQAVLLCVEIRVPLQMVDVNVHPQKMEVRFATTEVLLSLLQQTITQLVQRYLAAQQLQQDMVATPASSCAVVEEPRSTQAITQTSFQFAARTNLATRQRDVADPFDDQYGATGASAPAPVMNVVAEPTALTLPIPLPAVASNDHQVQLDWLCPLPNQWWIARCLKQLWLVDWSDCWAHLIEAQLPAVLAKPLLIPQKLVFSKPKSVLFAQVDEPCWQDLPWQISPLEGQEWLVIAMPWPWHGVDVQQALVHGPVGSGQRHEWLAFWLANLPRPQQQVPYFLAAEDPFLLCLQAATTQPKPYLQTITAERLTSWSNQCSPAAM